MLESIQFHLQVNNYKYHQSGLGLVKLLGELYNHGVVNSVVIFDTLYVIIHFCHDMTKAQLEAPLSEEMLRRIALVPDMKYEALLQL